MRTPLINNKGLKEVARRVYMRTREKRGNENGLDIPAVSFDELNMPFQHPKAPYNKLRTFAFIGMQFCKFLHDYENEMLELIKSRTGYGREGHLPCISELEACFDAYIGNYPVEPTQNTKISLAVLRKNLDNIEFQLNDL